MAGMVLSTLTRAFRQVGWTASSIRLYERTFLGRELTDGKAAATRLLSATSDAADTWNHLKESFTSILADVDSNSGVATITINRPEALNALNTKVIRFGVGQPALPAEQRIVCLNFYFFST